MATAEGGHPALAFVRSEIAAKSGTNESADRKTRRPAREPERMGCAEQGSSVTRGSRGAETDAWKHSRSIWRHLWAAPRVFWVTSNPPRAPGQARWRQCCEVRKFIGLLSAPCCCLRPFLRAPGPLPAARSSLGSSLLPRPPPRRIGSEERPQSPHACAHTIVRGSAFGLGVKFSLQRLRTRPRNAGGQGGGARPMPLWGRGGQSPTQLSLSLLVGTWALSCSSGS